MIYGLWSVSSCADGDPAVHGEGLARDIRCAILRGDEPSGRSRVSSKWADERTTKPIVAPRRSRFGERQERQTRCWEVETLQYDAGDTVRRQPRDRSLHSSPSLKLIPHVRSLGVHLVLEHTKLEPWQAFFRLNRSHNKKRKGNRSPPKTATRRENTCRWFDGPGEVEFATTPGKARLT